MLLYLSQDRTMSENFESIGRYTVAVEVARELGMQLRNAMLQLGRLTACSNIEAGCEFNLEEMRKLLDAAQTLQRDLQTVVAKANHEAALCGRPAIMLAKAGR